MRLPSRESPSDKVDVCWTIEVVPGASCDIHGPTATFPWSFARRSLQGQHRLVTSHVTSTGRPGGFVIQPIRTRPLCDPTMTHYGQKGGRPWADKTGSWPSHTHHGAEVSADQNVDLVWPTGTHYGQEVGCPQVVRNQKLAMVICCFSQSECILLLFGTGSWWSSLGHHGTKVLMSFAMFS